MNKPKLRTPAIHIKPNPWDDHPKPYLGAHRNGGMPGAREVIVDYTAQGRKNFDRYFGHTEDKVNNAKKVKLCKKTCEFHNKRKISNCAIYIDVSKCDKKNWKVKKIVNPDWRPPLKGMGEYDEI